jgi:glycosyltransferase involved in cell wall biosynthesis
MAADAARILLIAAATSTTGGGEHHVADLLRQLPARGFEVSLLCPPGGDLPRLAESLGVRVEAAPVDSVLPFSGVRAVRSAVAHLRPHVVHAHGSRAAFYARVGDPSAAKRCVYTVHGIHVDRAGSAPRRARLPRHRALAALAPHASSACARPTARGGATLGLLDPSRAVTIRNGISPSEPVEAGQFRGELGLSEKAPLVLSVGRFHEQKDQHTLIEAWARVSVRFTTAVLALVGSGPLESKLRDLANDRSVANSLRFVAPRRTCALPTLMPTCSC